MPGLKNLVRRIGRKHQIGLPVALLVTIGMVIAVMTDVLPFALVVIIGLIPLAVLVIRDLLDGDHEKVGQEATQPRIAQMKQNRKRPAPRL